MMDERKRHEIPEGPSGTGNPPPNKPPTAEPDVELSYKSLFNWTVILVVTLLVAIAVARMMMSKEIADIRSDPDAAVGYRQFHEPSTLKAFPEPKLQVAEAEDMKAWRAHENSILNHYGWADKNAKIARIPIEQAMKRLLQKGIPSRSGVNDSDLE